MNYRALRFTPLLFILLFACEEGIIDKDDTYSADANLIESIALSEDKLPVETDELPNIAKATLENDLADYFPLNAQLVPRLGYEVSLGGRGQNAGQQAAAYFDLDGRKLLNDQANHPDGRRQGKFRRGDFRSCFELVYPVTFLMPDGSSLVVEDSEGKAAVREWCEANPEITERPVLQFPIDILLGDSTLTIEDKDALREAYMECGQKGNRLRDKCFTFTYPLTFVMPDGSNITVESAEPDARSELKAWHLANPDSDERPTLVFPLNITLNDGSELIISNEDEMTSVKSDCRDSRMDGKKGPGGRRGPG